MEPLILCPHSEPSNFIDKWSHPLWKKCGVYLWSIEYRDAFLVSYVGQCFGAGTNFDRRIWQEFKWWAAGSDHPVDIEQYKLGVRVELPARPEGHTQRELAELKPLLRLWLIPLNAKTECDQAERWLVSRLCEQPTSRQFLANRNPHRYRPDASWPVRIDPPPSFRVVTLTVPALAR